MKVSNEKATGDKELEEKIMPAIIDLLHEHEAALHMLEILRRFLEGENDIAGDHYNDGQLKLLILY